VDQPVWEGVLKFKPELWVWLGDIVYADTQYFPAHWKPTALEKVKEKFSIQKQKPGYKKLLETCPITGHWDDHDFNNNNGGKEYEEKFKVQEILLDFLDEPKDSPRWFHEGVYGSYTFGPEGKRIKLIMIDNRYFRDQPIMNGSGDMLGEDQWKWFENEIKTSDAQINIITNGIQLLPSDKPVQEKWSNFPESRSRFFQILKTYNPSGVILWSGDIHYAEILENTCAGLRNPLYEVTASGMTHSCGTSLPLPVCRFFLNNFFVSKYQVSDFYEFFNFGTIEVDWEAKPVTVKLQVRNSGGDVVREQILKLDDKYEVLNSHCTAEDTIPLWIRLPQDFYRVGVTIVLGFILVSILRCIVRCFRKQKSSSKPHNKNE